MRPLSLVLPASLLLLASGASAQSMPYPENTSISTVQVTAPMNTVWIDPGQAEQLRGSYAMSNGWIMKVEASSHHIDAAFDKRKPIRLASIGDNRFVSADGNVSMEFNRGPLGDDVLMSYRPDPRLAQVVVITSRLAQR